MENEEALELTDAEREELDRRLELYKQDPEQGVSWEELKQRLIGSR